MKKDIKALLSEVEKKIVSRVHEKPSQEALDRLALFAGFQNWRTFQRQLHEGNSMEGLSEKENTGNVKTKEKPKQ